MRTAHGQAKTIEYRLWLDMCNRCFNPKSRHRANYGGRGITVCDRWAKFFLAFRDDMGPRPSAQHSVERIDNDSGYWCGKAECPECGPLGRSPNCRWATRKEQGRNKRTNHLITAFGKTMILADWAVAVGIDASLLRYRLGRGGWDVEIALTRRPGKGN